MIDRAPQTHWLGQFTFHMKHPKTRELPTLEETVLIMNTIGVICLRDKRVKAQLGSRGNPQEGGEAENTLFSSVVRV